MIILVYFTDIKVPYILIVKYKNMTYRKNKICNGIINEGELKLAISDNETISLEQKI